MTPRRMVGALASVLVVLSACGGSAERAGAPVPPSVESSPFVFDEATIPAGFEPIAAGTGTFGLEWGSDTGGSTEPFVLLGPPGEPGDLVVSLTGYAGSQGGLSQASLAYSNPASFEERDVGGQLAHFTSDPAGSVGGSFANSDLVVRHDDQIAIRVVSSFDATFDDLAAIVPLVEVPDELGVAPTLSGLPEGRELKGSLSSDAVLAFLISAGLDGVAAAPSAHAVGFASEDGPTQHSGTLQIVALPGTAGDIAAVSGYEAFGFGNVSTADTIVAGRAAVSVSHESSRFEERSLFTTTATGDLLIIGSEGTNALSTAELEAIAASVEATDQGSWDAFVEEVYGGPGLHPDEGRVELARGEADGLEWLAQTGEVVDPIPGTPVGDSSIDRCLKLSNHRRACASGSVGSEFGELRTAFAHEASEIEPFTFPPFAQVITAVPGERVRLTTDDGTVATADLIPIPDSAQRVAVMMLDPAIAGALTTCRPFPAPDEFGSLRFARLDVLDETGAPIACIGIS